MRREEYLYTLTEQIRCKMARGTIEQEINDHIEDQKAEFLSEGMSQTEAEEAAVREMGDPVEVGLEMDRIHRPTMAWGMIALIVGLSLAGYLLRSVMYQTALGIEQSAGKNRRTVLDRNVIELAYVAGTAGTFDWTCADDRYLLYGLYEDCGLCKTNLDCISGFIIGRTAVYGAESEWSGEVY